MPDANTVAIGAPGNLYSGHVRIYSWNGSDWVQKGQDIVGEETGDLSGWSVSMPDTNTVAIGAPSNSNNGGSNAGQVRIYTWNGTSWTQKGEDIDGEDSNDESGYSVSMPDVNTVAIGAPYNDNENGGNSGHVRIYSWDGTSWVQKGEDINGEDSSDESGWSVSMPDNNTVAIGAPRSGGLAGHVRIYVWDGTDWVQMGVDIDSEGNDFFGWSVSMPSAVSVAIGGPKNGGSGQEAGHVRVYDLTSLNIIENEFGDELAIYPNPTSGNITIDLGSLYNSVTVIVRDGLGQKVKQEKFNGKNPIHLSIKGTTGVYFVHVRTRNKNAILKVIKE